MTPADHAHHGDEVRDHDAPENIELLSASEHNRHHKTGTVHREASKKQIGSSLKRAYQEGRHPHPSITNRDCKGRITA